MISMVSSTLFASLSLASCSIGELSFVWKGLDFSSPFLLLVVMNYSVLSF
jgi:hypothetical protein